MTDYTVHHNIPFPEGKDDVAVHTDVELLAIKVDSEINAVSDIARKGADGAVPERVMNLFDPAATVPGTLSPSGNVNPHDLNRVSEFIPVDPGQAYTHQLDSAVHAVAYFDDTQSMITGSYSDWLGSSTPHTTIAPVQAAYARVVVSLSESTKDTYQMIFNRGTTLWSPSVYPRSGWWDNRELPPAVDVSIDQLTFSDGGKIGAEYLDGAVPERVMNLFDPATALSGSLSPSGNIFPHADNMVSDLIPVEPGEQYVAMNPTTQHMVLFLDARQSVIAGLPTGYFGSGTVSEWVAPDTAVWARLGLAISQGGDYTQMVFNRGTTLWSPDQQVTSGWWDDRELPPGVGAFDPAVIEPLIADIVRSMLPQWQPSPPTLAFETVATGWTRALWLTSDGQMLYGERDKVLEQSSDEMTTLEQVHVFSHTIGAIRELSDGELLVSTLRDNDAGVKSKLWKSTGYTRTSPTDATWTEVLEAGAENANITNNWGLSVYQNVVVASEYGLRNTEGSRRVWLSEDHGTTWTLAFDQMTTPNDIPGAPAWTITAHLHGAAWDPYWSRLWVICGDSPSTATYYSDDKGDTWTFVEGTGGAAPAPQFTGIMPLPDAVIFGSDRAPNGLWIARRDNKSDMPVIEPWHRVNDDPVISHIFGLAYKQDWDPATATYFDAHTAHDQTASLITGFVDAGKAHTLWEAATRGSGLPYSGQVRATLGPTAQGNIIALMEGDPHVTGHRIMKAPAPTWARV